MTPLLRWAGAKRWLAPTLAEEIESTNPKLYVEPFLGAGAVALAVSSAIPKLLGDINPTLMDFWRCVQKMPAALVGELQMKERRLANDQDSYLRARDELNDMILHPRLMWVSRAAMLKFINARCYNGLWRTNADGLFNVPFGKLSSPQTLDEADVQRVHHWAHNVTFKTGDYRALLDTASTNPKPIAVYLDSPYDETFDGYAKGGFDEVDQRDLAAWFWYLVRIGAKVWATNSDTLLIRGLYEGAKIEEIDEQHNIGATGERRGKRSCLLIRGG